MLSTIIWFLLIANWPASLARLDPSQLLALRSQTNANEHECLLTRSDHSTKMQGCQCLVYYSEEAKAGTIHSPFYPAAYPSNVGCLLFVMFANVSELVEIEFVDFDLARPAALSRSARNNRPSHAACGPLAGYTCLDKVSIYLTEKDELHDRDQPECELCGSLSELPSTRFLSYGRSIFLEFHSQSQPNKSKLGFMARYRFVRTDQARQSREFILNGTHRLTTKTSTRLPKATSKQRVTSMTTRLPNPTTATTFTTAPLVSDSAIRSVRTYDDYNYDDYYNAATTTVAVTAIAHRNNSIPCNRVYQSGHPEGLILSAKRQYPKHTALWTAANCTQQFAPNSPNTTFFFNGTGAENVQLTFMEIEFFRPGYKNADCIAANAYVELYEGTPSKNRRLARLCQIGSTINTLRSRCNQIYMVLYNGAQPSDSLLLRFNYRFVPFRRNSRTLYRFRSLLTIAGSLGKFTSYSLLFLIHV